jgi:hypothetical protein
MRSAADSKDCDVELRQRRIPQQTRSNPCQE